MKRPKRNRYPQRAGASNDFFSVKKKKEHGSLSKFLYKQRSEKIKEEQIRRINLLDEADQKAIHLDLLFPQPVPTPVKNYRKHIVTLQKRLARLRVEEKFWPYVYRDIKELEGKIITVRPEQTYRETIITYWIETQDKVWNVQTKEFDGPKPVLGRKQCPVGNDVFIGMTTGFAIVYMDDRTAKPVQLMAAQVLFNEKLLYVDINNLIVKSSLLSSLGSK